MTEETIINKNSVIIKKRVFFKEGIDKILKKLSIFLYINAEMLTLILGLAFIYYLNIPILSFVVGGIGLFFPFLL